MSEKKMLEKAKKVDAGISVVLADFRDLRWEEEGGVIYKDTSYALSPQTERDLLDLLQIPAPYWERIDNQLRKTTFDHLARHYSGEKADVKIFSSDGKLIAVRDARFPLLSCERVWEIMENNLYTDWEIEGEFASDFCRIVVKTPERKEVRKGDVVQLGATLTFSPVWFVYPNFKEYVYRLVCSNGLVLRRDGGSYKFRAGEHIYQRLEEAVNEVFAGIEDRGLVERFQHLASHEIPPEDFESELNRYFRAYQVAKEYRPRIREIIEENGDYTAWGIINAITWFGTHALRGIERHQMQSLAGNIVVNEHVCRTCKRPL